MLWRLRCVEHKIARDNRWAAWRSDGNIESCFPLVAHTGEGIGVRSAKPRQPFSIWSRESTTADAQPNSNDKTRAILVRERSADTCKGIPPERGRLPSCGITDSAKGMREAHRAWMPTTERITPTEIKSVCNEEEPARWPAAAAPAAAPSRPAPHTAVLGSKQSSPHSSPTPTTAAPTVAEVLRSAKAMLQPTHVAERQFYIDCYRACQAGPSSPSSTTHPASSRFSSGAAPSAGSGGAKPAPTPTPTPTPSASGSGSGSPSPPRSPPDSPKDHPQPAQVTDAASPGPSLAAAAAAAVRSPTRRPTSPISATGSGGTGSVPAAASTAVPIGSAPSSGTAAPKPYLSSVPEVALRLSCLGHRVVVRRVIDSKHYWSKSMANLFCYSLLPGTGIGYVVDPAFREHFRAGRMSDRYRDIWECLPPLFVGPPAKLAQLVQLLVGELHASFESCGRQLPPWRTFNATINRWMSPAFRDVPVPLRKGVQALPLGTLGRIPAAEAQAFLRTCAKLMLPGGGGGGSVGRRSSSHGGSVRRGSSSSSSTSSSSASSGGREASGRVSARRERAEGGGSSGSGSSGSQHGEERAGSGGSSGGKELGQAAGGEGQGAAGPGPGAGAGGTGAAGGQGILERGGSGVGSGGEAGERRSRREEMRQTARRILTAAANRARGGARAHVQEGFTAPAVGPAAVQGRGGVTAGGGPMDRTAAAAGGEVETGGWHSPVMLAARPPEGALASASPGDAAGGGSTAVVAAAEAGLREGAGSGAYGTVVVGAVQQRSRSQRPMGLLAKALQQQQEQRQQEQRQQQQR